MLGLAAMFPLAGFADPVPGLIRALTELHQAYDTFSTAKSAVDDAQRQIKPSADFSGAAKNYQLAASHIVAIVFPPPPTPPSEPPVATVTSCTARASAISALSSGIADIKASLASIQSEISQLNDGIKEIEQTRDTVVVIEKAMPTIASVPIWGDSVASELFSMNKNVRDAVGNAVSSNHGLDQAWSAETPILRRLKQDGTALKALSASLTTWTNALTISGTECDLSGRYRVFYKDDELSILELKKSGDGYSCDVGSPCTCSITSVSTVARTLTQKLVCSGLAVQNTFTIAPDYRRMDSPEGASLRLQ
jgi:hypothetical protein